MKRRARSRHEVLTLCQPPGSPFPDVLVEVVTTAKACIVRQRAANVAAHGKTREQLLVASYSWWMEKPEASAAERAGAM